MRLAKRILRVSEVSLYVAKSIDVTMEPTDVSPNEVSTDRTERSVSVEQ